MKLYEIKSAGETGLIAAPTFFAALKHWLNKSDLTVDDMDDEDEMREVPQSEWASITIQSEGDEDNTTTVDELMKTQSETEIICSTAYLN